MKLKDLVKWKDYGVEANSWEPEGHFDTVRPIEEYWRKQNITVVSDSSGGGSC
jgi:hypothetical protein